MSWSAQLLISAASAAFSGLLLMAVGGITWYVRKYVLSEVEKNSAVRRHLVGEEAIEDDGQLDELDTRLDDMERKRKQEHAEVRRQLEYVIEYVRRIAANLNRETDAEVRDPENGEPTYYRGGGGSSSDD